MKILPEIEVLRAEEELMEALWRRQPHIVTDEEARIPSIEEVIQLTEKVEDARSTLQERKI